MKKHFLESPAFARDAVCRVAFLIVFICVVLISFAMRELHLVPSGNWWFSYKILASLVSILPLLPLARHVVIIDMLDIAFYEMLLFAACAVAAVSSPVAYAFLYDVLAPAVVAFLFYLTFLRLLWIPFFNAQAQAPDWPPIGLFGLASRRFVARRATLGQTGWIVLAIALLGLAAWFSGRPQYEWGYLLIGCAGLILVARYGPVFIRLLSNTINDRQRLAWSLEETAHEMALLKQSLAAQAVLQPVPMDEVAAELVLEQTITPAGRELLQLIALVHPAIRHELIKYILEVCRTAPRKPMLTCVPV